MLVLVTVFFGRCAKKSTRRKVFSFIDVQQNYGAKCIIIIPIIVILLLLYFIFEIFEKVFSESLCFVAFYTVAVIKKIIVSFKVCYIILSSALIYNTKS